MLGNTANVMSRLSLSIGNANGGGALGAAA
jgi:hypothetical protein